MRAKLRKIDRHADLKEVIKEHNILIEELERVLCRIGEDNLDASLRERLKKKEDK